MKSAEEIVKLIGAKMDEYDEMSRCFWGQSQDKTNTRSDRIFFKKQALNCSEKVIDLKILLKEISGEGE